MRSGPVMVVGTLALMPVQTTGAAVTTGSEIELPDVDVSLENDSGTSVGTARTQLDGKFRVQAPGPGSYRICWKSPAIGSGCGVKFAVASRSVWLRYVPVTAPRGIIHGRVLTGDARPCWINDPFFGLNVSTRVSLIETPAVLQQVRANISGEYAFAGVPMDRRYQVRAECEAAVVETTVSLGGVAQANMTLPNRAPRLTGISRRAGGQAISRAAPGAMVTVDAELRDPDNDPIEYRWRTLDGSMPGTNTRQQEWKLATMRGLQSSYLIARDGRGGYAFDRIDLPVGASDAGFAGRVIEESTMNPVGGARVEVSGVTTTTSADGWFSLRAPIKPFPERYVLNITHPQYARLSRIHARDALGNTYELTRAQTSTHNPAQVIDITDTASGGPCGTPGGQRVPPLRPLRASVTSTKGQTGYSTPATQPDPRPCRHRGARITLPGGSLEDLDDNPPAPGNVSLSFATLNPSRRSLPGDYRAIARNGRPVEMLSFGALYAEFRGSDGKLLRLREGASADVLIPVSDQQRPVAPPSIAMWHYDDVQGMWIEDDAATLQNTPAGWMYVGKTTHFSEINMDVAGDDPDEATCVGFTLGQSLAGWTDLVVRAYVSYAGTSIQVKETALDNQEFHAVFRIPYAPPAPPINTLRLELRGTYNGQQVLLLNNVIATDAPRPKMLGQDLWPPPDYQDCGEIVVLEADPVNLPPYGDNDATGRPFFLTGPYGTFLPENGEEVATRYYETLDPGDASYPTLSEWWDDHGFDSVTGAGGTSAPYLNHNDLGFGRDMNCLEDQPNAGDLSCYVTNYGLPDQNPTNADYAFDKQQDKKGATVAMEYLASEANAARRVRFYVYEGGDPAAANKLKFADLDGLGPKPVPHLCMVCHGGIYVEDLPNSYVEHARFREFDLPSFKYPGGESWDFGDANLDANQLEAFAQLNRMIQEISPPASPIHELITLWYGNSFSFGEAPVQPALPGGWDAGDANVYHNVYGKSCRTCHVARDENGSGLTLNSSADFQSTYYVCGSPKRMPNAFVTWKNFWGDPQRVIDYAVFTGQDPCQ